VPGIDIPPDVPSCTVHVGRKSVSLTNLQKVFWPRQGLHGKDRTKRDLLLYYATVADVLIPHLRDRAMVMKRYPNGIEGDFFFMKRTPENHPDWLEICQIPHRAGNIIGFPMAQDLAALLWIVNLGCIDLNQWYGCCPRFDHPDYVHFDLDPVPPAGFAKVRQAALLIRDRLKECQVNCYCKTTGSRGIHLYVPIQNGPAQKQVWTTAKRLAVLWAKENSALLTSEYRIEKRPAGRVLVDYNQNAWGRTLASVYSVRPKPKATVSTPLTWEEVENGVELEDFTMDNVPERIKAMGDLFRPLLQAKSRVPLERLA
jgi:bifunctional non-homologous end joining protein LigD